jgi:uncharacterized hydrophobic protein (TIGR00271 family)
MKDSRRNYLTLRAFLKEYFDMQREKENQSEVIEYIRNGIEYKGARLWILLISIVIASVGLNVNAIYVIIGAMLISPMMGPLMGIGLSVGMSDFGLLKRSLKSYLTTTLFSLVTATLYFIISPVSVVPSDFIFQTTPTFYNVVIAFAGGLAGFIALSTTKKGTVLVGVSIVTALIPPLCAAGYGLSSHNFIIFLGALYLYFIDSLFICVATFIGTRWFKFPKKEYVSHKQEKRVRRYMYAMALISLCPVVYMSIGIINNAIFNTYANRFVSEQFNYKGSSVVYNKCLNNPDGEKIIQVVLAGKELPSSTIEQIRTKLPEYKLDDVELEVLQGIKGGDINPSHIHSMMMYPREKGLTKYTSPSKNAEQSVELNKFIENQSLSQQLLPEVKLLFPNVLSIKIGSLYQQEDSSKGMDTLKMAVVHFEKKVSDKDKTKLNAWLKVRTKEHKNYSLIEK